MARVFLAQNCLFCRDAPVDAKRLVLDGNAVIGFWMIEIVALVLEYGRLAQHGKAVGKAFRDKELTMILLGQFDGNVLPVGWRALADVNCNVQYRPFHAAHQFALGVGRALEMLATHDAIRRHAFVVLHKIDGADLLFELPLGEGLEEIAPRIFEHLGFYDE